MDDPQVGRIADELASVLARAKQLASVEADDVAAFRLALACEWVETAIAVLCADGDALDGDATHRASSRARIPSLTARERETLGWMERGLRNKEIADAMNVTERTVAFHVGNVLAKLGSDGRVEAIHHARQLGLLPAGVAPAREAFAAG